MDFDLAFFRDDFGEERTVPASAVGREPAVETLARFALAEALSPAERNCILRARSFALVVEVPSAEWVEPVRSACEAMRGWPTVFARTGSSRLEDVPSRGGDKVAHTLARGGFVLGVSQACDRYLPSALVAATDARVRVGSPSNAVITRVIKAATGGRVPAMAPRVTAGLGYFEICAAIREGVSARSCVDRLLAAANAKSVVDAAVAEAPPFEELRGYGASHDWGMRLLRDLESWRRGHTAFHLLDRNVVLASAPGLGK